MTGYKKQLRARSGSCYVRVGFLPCAESMRDLRRACQHLIEYAEEMLQDLEQSTEDPSDVTDAAAWQRVRRYKAAIRIRALTKLRRRGVRSPGGTLVEQEILRDPEAAQASPDV